MSSYKVDPKTNMLILYLKNQKSELWKKFLQEYPDNMKKISFITRLIDRLFRYRDDLDGLYSICNKYKYQVFEDLIILIKSNIIDKYI